MIISVHVDHQLNMFVLTRTPKIKGDRNRMVVGLQLPMQSVPITTKAVRSNPAHGEMYSMQHYMIKYVLRQVGDFLKVLRFPSPIKLTATT